MEWILRTYISTKLSSNKHYTRETNRGGDTTLPRHQTTWHEDSPYFNQKEQILVNTLRRSHRTISFKNLQHTTWTWEGTCMTEYSNKWTILKYTVFTITTLELQHVSTFSCKSPSGSVHQYFYKTYIINRQNRLKFY